MKRSSMVAAILVGMFASCDTIKPVTDKGNVSEQLRKNGWVLTQINNTNLNPVPAKEISLNFNTLNTISGNGGCNTYGGQYMISGTKAIKFTSVYSTKMACDNLEQENAYFQALNNADAYELEGNTLRLMKGSQEILEFNSREKQ